MNYYELNKIRDYWQDNHVKRKNRASKNAIKVRVNFGEVKESVESAIIGDYEISNNRAIIHILIKLILLEG